MPKFFVKAFSCPSKGDALKGLALCKARAEEAAQDARVEYTFAEAIPYELKDQAGIGPFYVVWGYDAPRPLQIGNRGVSREKARIGEPPRGWNRWSRVLKVGNRKVIFWVNWRERASLLNRLFGKSGKSEKRPQRRKRRWR